MNPGTLIASVQPLHFVLAYLIGITLILLVILKGTRK